MDVWTGVQRGHAGAREGWRAQGRGGGQVGDAGVREGWRQREGLTGAGVGPQHWAGSQREAGAGSRAGLGAGCPLLLFSFSLLRPVQGVQLAGQAGCPFPHRRREEGAQQMAAHKGTSGRRRRRRTRRRRRRKEAGGRTCARLCHS